MVQTKVKTSRHRTPEDITLGQRIRQIRQNRQLSQTALADKLGVSFQQIQKYEQGKNRLSAMRLVGIAQALNTTPHDLLCWAETIPQPTKETVPHSRPLSICASVDRKAAELWRRLQNDRARKALVQLMAVMGETENAPPCDSNE